MDSASQHGPRALMRRPEWPPTAVAVLLLVLSGACRDGLDRRTAAPFAPEASLRRAVDCSGTCVLADGVAILRAATPRPDSAGVVLGVATETIIGTPGDSVTVVAAVGAGIINALGVTERLLVQVGNRVSTYSIADASAGVVVYRFKSSEAVRVAYALSRDVHGGIPDGQFRLTQTTSAASVQVSYMQPLTPAGGSKPPPCSITQASATVCGTVVTLAPFFAPPDGIGGTFTSQNSSAASDTIVINFSVPVESFFVKIWDPTFDGNKVVAYDGAGTQLASADFSYTGIPGDNQPDSQTVAATGIRRVVLVPAPGDYVSYDARLTLQTAKLIVSASADSASAGDTLTYTASDVLGGAITVTRWQWVPDTGTTPPPGFTEKLSVSSCGTSLTCKHTPGTSGTIKVYGKRGHNTADSASRHITVAQPHISVACTPSSVVRASDAQVTCTAAAAGRTLAVTGWTFTATDTATGRVVRSTDTTSTQWSGVVVSPGTVTVQGTVDGVAASSDTGSIAVTARTTGWSWYAESTTGDATPGTWECNPLPHYSTAFFGWATADSTCANLGLFLWPNPIGEQRGFVMTSVAGGGPNAGLYYVQQDTTRLRLRAQVLKDLRPDGALYTVSEGDTVSSACEAAGILSAATVASVNTNCMHYVGPFKFDSLYQFTWAHERCHLSLALQEFNNLPDGRARMEPLVRQDTAALNKAVVLDPNGLLDINQAVADSSGTIDQRNPNSFSFWSRDSTNSAWFPRTFLPNGILAPGC